MQSYMDEQLFNGQETCRQKHTLDVRPNFLLALLLFQTLGCGKCVNVNFVDSKETVNVHDLKQKPWRDSFIS